MYYTPQKESEMFHYFTEVQKQVYVWYEREGKTLKEIAKLRGKTTQSVFYIKKGIETKLRRRLVRGGVHYVSVNKG
jgi:DNA-directed RNA polymerase specialized sigma subunit